MCHELFITILIGKTYILKKQNYLKLMMKNLSNIFNIDYDVHYHPTKSRIKIQLVHKKNDKLHYA
jgi:hypothetical protein